MRHKIRKAVLKKMSIRQQRQIAFERIEILLNTIEQDPLDSFVPNYINFIEKLARRWKIIFPKKIIGRYCKDCKRYFVPGSNCAVRIKDKKPVVVCACGSERPLKQKIFKH